MKKMLILAGLVVGVVGSMQGYNRQKCQQARAHHKWILNNKIEPLNEEEIPIRKKYWKLKNEYNRCMASEEPGWGCFVTNLQKEYHKQIVDDGLDTIQKEGVINYCNRIGEKHGVRGTTIKSDYAIMKRYHIIKRG